MATSLNWDEIKEVLYYYEGFKLTNRKRIKQETLPLQMQSVGDGWSQPVRYHNEWRVSRSTCSRIFAPVDPSRWPDLMDLQMEDIRKSGLEELKRFTQLPKYGINVEREVRYKDCYIERTKETPKWKPVFRGPKGKIFNVDKPTFRALPNPVTEEEKMKRDYRKVFKQQIMHSSQIFVHPKDHAIIKGLAG